MDYLNLFLFFFIICSMIIPSTFFKFGQGFNLNSNYVVFITTEGIIKYDPQTQEETTIIDFGFPLPNFLVMIMDIFSVG